MEHAVFRAGRTKDAGPGCITRWLPAALAREARRIRAIADDGSTTPCGVMFEESDSVVEKLIKGIRPHPCVYDSRKLEYREAGCLLGAWRLFRPYAFGTGSCGVEMDERYGQDTTIARGSYAALAL
ncbi:hypothetical protein HPB47_008206 [Ixodes persulcatus]|uniref:Uncharacterized protein n=1 Tax=Ixodes persulcatus TaxID=34615 RepID=A0AC60P5R6_IXOPE|nr:hypothetical protein HPB47_008206 [Ixodes persulcatus]